MYIVTTFRNQNSFYRKGYGNCDKPNGQPRIQESPVGSHWSAFFGVFLSMFSWSGIVPRLPAQWIQWWESWVLDRLRRIPNVERWPTCRPGSENFCWFRSNTSSSRSQLAFLCFFLPDEFTILTYYCNPHLFLLMLCHPCFYMCICFGVH